MAARVLLSHRGRMVLLQLAVAWLVLSGLCAVLVCALCRGGRGTDAFPH